MTSKPSYLRFKVGDIVEIDSRHYPLDKYIIISVGKHSFSIGYGKFPIYYDSNTHSKIELARYKVGDNIIPYDSKKISVVTEVGDSFFRYKTEGEYKRTSSWNSHAHLNSKLIKPSSLKIEDVMEPQVNEKSCEMKKSTNVEESAWELVDISIEIEEQKLQDELQKKIDRSKAKLRAIRQGIKTQGSWWKATIDMTPLSLTAIMAAVAGISALTASLIPLVQ